MYPQNSEVLPVEQMQNNPIDGSELKESINSDLPLPADPMGQ